MASKGPCSPQACKARLSVRLWATFPHPSLSVQMGWGGSSTGRRTQWLPVPCFGRRQPSGVPGEAQSCQGS